MSHPLRVTIWNEYIHELQSAAVSAIYPEGMHAVWSEAISQHLGVGVRIRVATLEQEEHGLTYETLAETDVLTWWGHAAFEVRTPGGAVILIDPWLKNPKAPKDAVPPASVDAILVTHGHMDHVGEAADLAKLPEHFQYCLAHGHRPVAPACLNS